MLEMTTFRCQRALVSVGHRQRADGTSCQETAMLGYRIITVCGQDIPLQERQVKGKDKTWFAFGTNPGFGSAIPALADTLPSVIQYEGQDFILTHGLTGMTKDGVLADGVKPEDQRPRVYGTGPVTFDPTTGEVRNLSASISITKSGDWNLKVGLTTVPEVGSGSSTRKVVDLDALLASVRQ
jgi:hypothetical protein